MSAATAATAAATATATAAAPGTSPAGPGPRPGPFTTMMQEGGGAVLLAVLIILTAWFFCSWVRATIWHTWDITEAMAKMRHFQEAASPTIGADGGRVGAKDKAKVGKPPPEPDAVDQGKRRPLASRFPACC